MKGDFSRSTFKRKNGFTSVLMQQGRVLLDADFNEQSAIVLHYMRTLAQDLIGPHDPNIYDLQFHHGGTGFHLEEIIETLENGDPHNTGLLRLSPGRYYVDGILCENASSGALDPQPTGPDGRALNRNVAHLFYLDVWERLITALEDPRIREVALGADDTCARSQVVWQLKSLAFNPVLVQGPRDRDIIFANIEAALNDLSQRGSTAMMSADLVKSEITPDPCIQPPDSRYRGSENQLYRVEIHTGGTGAEATFKWSRDNGSVTFPIVDTSGNNLVQLEHLGRDWRSSLQIGDWVEIVDDTSILRGETRPLLVVKNIFHDTYGVELARSLDDKAAAPDLGELDAKNHALLRRWDHRIRADDVTVEPADGAFMVEPGLKHTLEDGIEITFTADQDGGPVARYNVGDYWLITARTNGTIDWPQMRASAQDDTLIPEPLPAAGIQHHYAPLAVVTFENNVITVAETYDNGNRRLYHALSD